MKLYLPVIVTLILFTSCSSSHYTTIDSNTLTKNEQSVYVAENDTIRVEYNFSNYNGHMHVRIYNKCKAPIHIKWKESAIIANGKAFSYYNQSSKISGSFDSNTESNEINAAHTKHGSFNGNLTNSAEITFIPPQSFIDCERLHINSIPKNGIAKHQLKKQKIQVKEFKYKAHSVYFTTQNTPLQFSSYISYTIGNVQHQSLAMQHDFYISGYIKTRLSSETWYQGKPIPANTYEISNSTIFTKFMAVGVTIVLLLILL